MEYPFNGHKPNDYEQLVLDAYTSGLSMKKVSTQHGISIGNLYHLLIPYNAGPRPRSRTGADNHAWKGGKVSLANAIRTCYQYRVWHRDVYIQAKHTCAFCGIIPNKHNKAILQCDHIVPLHQILDNHSIITLEQAKDCNALWDISNGRILCKDCHKKTSTYGCNRKKKSYL